MKLGTASKITKNDLLVIPFYAEKNPSSSQQAALGTHSRADFEGKANESTMLYQKDKITPRILLIGLGKEKEESTEIWRAAGGTVSKSLKKPIQNISILPPKETPELIGAFIEGLLLGHYRYEQFINDPERKLQRLKSANVVTSQRKTPKALTETLKEAQVLADAIRKTRDMINAPNNAMTPQIVAREAQGIARQSRKITCKVFNERQLAKMGMNCLVSVGAGAKEDTKLIALEYKYKPKNKKPIVLVGKGICFDAGGLDIKTRDMKYMKYDMTGAATVLGVFRVLTQLKIPVHVIALAPCAENLVDALSTKPGDVIKAYDGTNVEITNTDAEGRLVMCDAIGYAVKKYKPEAIIDIATLTGAAIIAVGYEISALMTNDDKLANKVKTAAKDADEKVWELPLDENYKKKIKSPIADVANYTSGVGAGTIMGGAYLEHFTKGTPWVHLDMGGSAWAENDDFPYIPKGASGRNIRLLWTLLKNY